MLDWVMRWDARNWGRRCVAAACALGLLAGLFRGRADAAPLARPEPPRAAPAKATRPLVLMLVSESDVTTGRGVYEVVRSQVADLALRWQAVKVPALPARLPGQLALALQLATKQGALASVWCEWPAGGRAYLYLALTAGSRLVVRELSTRGRSRVAALESIGVILRTALGAMLADGGQASPRRPVRLSVPSRPIVAPRSPVSAASSPPTTTLTRRVETPRRRRPARRWGLHLAYRYEGLSREEQALHGGRIAMQARVSPRWAIFLAYQIMAPITAHTALAEVRLWRHPLDMGALVAWRFGRLGLGMGASLELTVVQQRNRATGVSYSSSPSRLDAEVSAALFVRGAVRLHPRLWLVADVGASVALLNHRYLVERAGGSEVVLDPWPAHPIGRLGLAVELF